MKLIFALILSVFAVSVNEINASGAKWVAAETGITTEELKQMCGSFPLSQRPLLPVHAVQSNDPIPAEFDARRQWTGCPSIGKIYDQGHCGSCWAMGAFETLQDRACIQSQGKNQVELAAQDLVSCDSGSMGCDGGWPSDAWRYMRSTGIVTERCYPYAMGTCKHPGCSDWPTPNCNQTCANKVPFKGDKHFATSAYSVPSNVEAIQKELMSNGPIEVAFTVYQDFANYKSGIYHHVSGSSVGGHAVKMIGWGVEAGTPYWLIVNSWNTQWGENGLFRILRGKNECGIESEGVAGLAKI